MAFVYVLRSLKDGKRYIGSTIDLEKRLLEHNNGSVQSTKNRRPLVLESCEEFESIQNAALFEKKYKISHGALERAVRNGRMKLK